MTETQLQTMIAKYIKLQYPDVIFTSESSGQRTTIGMAKRMKAQRSKGKLPDMIILEPRGEYYGLMLELKVKDIFLKDGSIKAGREREQAEMLLRLSRKGYAAFFGIGFDKTKEIIDNYLR